MIPFWFLSRHPMEASQAFAGITTSGYVESLHHLGVLLLVTVHGRSHQLGDWAHDDVTALLAA